MKDDRTSGAQDQTEIDDADLEQAAGGHNNDVIYDPNGDGELTLDDFNDYGAPPQFPR